MTDRKKQGEPEEGEDGRTHRKVEACIERHEGRDHGDRPAGGIRSVANFDRRPDEEGDETGQDIMMLEEVSTVGGQKYRGPQQGPG